MFGIWQSHLHLGFLHKLLSSDHEDVQTISLGCDRDAIPVREVYISTGGRPVCSDYYVLVNLAGLSELLDAAPF